MMWPDMNIFRKQKFSEEDVLNIGLDFSMEFGENWLQPIHDRLLRRVPILTSEELEQYDSQCRSTRDEAIKDLHSILDDIDPKSPRAKSDVYSEYSTSQKKKHTWINERNLNHLFAQGMYYAWKDGVGVKAIR